MGSLQDFGKQYAEEIRQALRQDRIARTAGLIKKAVDLATSSNLAKAMKKIGKECEGLVYTGTDKSLSEEHKQEIANEIARQLGWNAPGTIRRLIKGGSVDALMQVSQQMEDLFTAVKK